MTHQIQSNELNAAVQLLASHGFEGMANAMQILFNEDRAVRVSQRRTVPADRGTEIVRQRLQGQNRQHAARKT
jgi:hypothetical protein